MIVFDKRFHFPAQLLDQRLNWIILICDQTGEPFVSRFYDDDDDEDWDDGLPN